MSRQRAVDGASLQQALAEGASLERVGNWQQAAGCYQAALAREGEHPALLNALALVLARAGNPGTAAQMLTRACELAPADPVLRNNLGNVYAASGQHRQAAHAYEDALRLSPDYANASFNLGSLLERAGRGDEALACFEQVVRLREDDAEAWNTIGVLRANRGEREAAEAALARAVRLARDAQVLVNMGNVHLSWGDGVTAERLFERAIEIDPRHLRAWENLVRARRMGPADRGLVDRLRGLLGEPGFSPREQASLHFALAKALDDLGEYDDAFAHAAAANGLRRAEQPFDRAAFGAAVDGILATFDEEWLRERAGAGEPSPLPVFVFGMMRSGTTLLEQILSSHPAVLGGGEMGVLGGLAGSLARAPGATRGYPWCARTVDATVLRDLGRAYLARLPVFDSGVLRVTDKMTSNYLHVGLIAAALPGASLVHCERDPADVSLSIYFQSFVDGNHYSHDFEDIAYVYREHERLMTHWNTLLPGRILRMRYEDVVADTAAQARRLVAHCGLEWDDACADHTGNRRVVQTASVSQTRQPIYRRSLARWRNYERHLQPLLAALGR